MSQWKPVISPFGMGYSEGFDPEATYEFKRLGDEAVSTFRMRDQHPYFNVCGLFWREPREHDERDWTKLSAYRPNPQTPPRP